MVTIYVLINPFNNEPFYVGSTNQKLSTRLAQHLKCDYGTGIASKKEIINDAKQAGLTIEILPLLLCSRKATVKCERHIYTILINNGYTLHQLPNRICNTVPLD